MLVLRATTRSAKRLNVSIDPSPPASTTRLGDWYANLVHVGRLQCTWRHVAGGSMQSSLIQRGSFLSSPSGSPGAAHLVARSFVLGDEPSGDLDAAVVEHCIASKHSGSITLSTSSASRDDA